VLWSDLFIYGTSLSRWCCHVNEFNKLVFVLVQHSRIQRYFLVIIICHSASTTAYHMPDWKYSEGGPEVKLGFKIGHCMKKLENHWSTAIANRAGSSQHTHTCCHESRSKFNSYWSLDTVSETQQKQTKSILPAKLNWANKLHYRLAERATNN